VSPKDIDREHRAHLKSENEQHITTLVRDTSLGPFDIGAYLRTSF
jgi:hypothetical protein